jgi:hypothetical protein
VFEDSGILELKEFRDSLIFRYVPPLPAIPFAWNPNNTGPLYFLVVLTAGVVIPSLRWGAGAAAQSYWTCRAIHVVCPEPGKQQKHTGLLPAVSPMCAQEYVHSMCCAQVHLYS